MQRVLWQRGCDRAISRMRRILPPKITAGTLRPGRHRRGRNVSLSGVLKPVGVNVLIQPIVKPDQVPRIPQVAQNRSPAAPKAGLDIIALHAGSRTCVSYRSSSFLSTPALEIVKRVGTRRTFRIAFLVLTNSFR